ncbi:MAG: hypothetical protein IPK35_21775 [Saprospiraceae bacterium]|nr:hypothetical protein [Saprospiraceae bacterium]
MDRAKLLEKFSQLLDEIELKEQTAENFYDFEKFCVEQLQELNRNVVERSIGVEKENYRKKKTITGYYGEMNLNKHHRFITSITGCKMSPLLKDIVCYVGQSECYESSSEMLFKTLCIHIDNNKVHRLCTELGEECTNWLEADRTDAELKEDMDDKGEKVLYSHCDGGFVLTREEKWKEAKVGRVYTSDKLLKINPKRGVIEKSWYTFHIGDHKTFKQKMEEYLDDYEHLKERLVFIIDGATWIHNWIDTKYPASLQILDFYHAYEKICLFSTKVIKEKPKRKNGRKKYMRYY